MKRFLVGSIIAVMLGTTAFAGVHHHYDKNRNIKHCTYQKKQSRINPENEKMRILVAEKKLEIRKELLNEKPDWNKIERINTEIAVKKSQRITENMKQKFENQQNRQKQQRKINNTTKTK